MQLLVIIGGETIVHCRRVRGRAPLCSYTREAGLVEPKAQEDLSRVCSALVDIVLGKKVGAAISLTVVWQLARWCASRAVGSL